MNLRSETFCLSITILCVILFSGCNYLTPHERTEISGPSSDTITATENNNTGYYEEAADVPPVPVADIVTPLPSDQEEIPVSESTEELEQEVVDDPVEAVEPADQELIDSALGYCEASNDFLEQGDADNAIDALDKAYSLILKIDGTDDPEMLQQREDMRLTISKHIMEVYSTRYTTVNGNGKAIPLDMNSFVKKEIESFQGKERRFFLDSYVRSGRYRPAIVKALEEAGFPEELSWLPLIESGFKVRAQSSARALGMWQFIASTGYRYGLKRDTWIDERMDPVKSTAAAIGYLSDLHHIFGDWILALAAYNCGEKRVLNEINRQKNSLLDDFWDLYQRLPNETARYVPRFLAVLHIISDPAAYGFELPQVDEEDVYEEITINKQLDLKTIAKALDVNSDVIKDLNPELRQNATPKSAYSLKIPVGKGEILTTKLSELPVYVAETTYEGYHKVRSGETLSGIANKYGTSVSAIMRANNLSNPNYLRVGMRLRISSGSVQAKASASQSPVSLKGSNEYVVRKGDSLYKIANSYNTTIQTLKLLNGLSGTRLSVGQKLMIPSRSSGVLIDTETKNYTVRRGDSPYLIAKKYNMDLYEFLKVNNLSPQSTIFPGQVVRVASE
ncbi:MAG: LysM peptidoglycan-binding domain-containing protein [Deltaproteobacteria bacterium]|nr:LysM peptidoglycan-binding domain-containing protein [Deltaproteobacteria bacterium]